MRSEAHTVREALDLMQRPDLSDERKWKLLAFVLYVQCQQSLCMDIDHDYWPSQNKEKSPWWKLWRP